MVSLLAAIGGIVACAVAEWLHHRRVRRVAWLAFGPGGAPRAWTRLAPPLRVAACGAVAWGLVALLQLDAAAWQDERQRVEQRNVHHLVIALDVSPSMHVEDAGPRGTQTRADRARDVLRSLLERIDERRTRTSIVAFYSTARPVVIDTFDPDVIENILDDLPLEHAFDPGKTDMYSGVEISAEIARQWPAGSATLLFVSDGDTLPAKQRPSLPPAYASVLVLGVGDPRRGTFIDEHSSRQDALSLEQLALQLGGVYHDVNARHLPTQALRAMSEAVSFGGRWWLDRRQAALLAVASGAAVLALLPVLLTAAGAGYRPPNVVQPTTAGNHQPERREQHRGKRLVEV